MQKIVIKEDVKRRQGVPPSLNDGRYSQRSISNRKAYNRQRDRKIDED